MTEEKLTGFILAGGKSSRMGTDKALLSYHGKPLLNNAIELILPFCDTVLVSGNKKEYSVSGIEPVPDIYEDCGPISGIFSVLNHSTTEWNIVLSVDMPFITRKLIEQLIANKNGDCVVPKHSLGVEPLIGLYNKSAIETIRQMIESGDFRMTKLLSALNTNYLDCNFLLKEQPNLFLNVNRTDDYQLISGN